MKKVLITMAMIAGSAVAFSQNFYFRGGLGYAFAQAGQSANGSGTPFNGTVANNTSSQTYDIKNASFSAGLQGYIGFGYMVNNNIGIQLDAHLGIAPKKYTLRATNVDLGNGVMGEVTTETQANAPLFLAPSLVLQTGRDKLNIYSRFGLALPLSTSMTERDVLQNYPGSGTVLIDEYTFTITNSFSLGFAGAAGVKYNFNDRVGLWGEASLLSCSVFIKKAELTDLAENGVSYPVSQYPGNTIINFSKSATVDNSSSATQVAYTQPFSNVAINIGVSFNLGRGGSRNRHQESEPGKPFRRR